MGVWLASLKSVTKLCYRHVRLCRLRLDLRGDLSDDDVERFIALPVFVHKSPELVNARSFRLDRIHVLLCQMMFVQSNSRTHHRPY